MQQPLLTWDFGTAYDFFMSLGVLHEPDRWGLRGAWAAGVRSRLSAESRTFLRDAQCLLAPQPHAFIHRLPAAKDAQAVLDQIAQTPIEQRLPALFGLEDYRALNPKRSELIDRILTNGRYDANELKLLHSLQEKTTSRLTRKESERLADWLCDSAEFGARILDALQNYFDVFFAEEEQRIQPFLEAALDRARLLAETHNIKTLLETLSNGVTYSEGHFAQFETVVLVPSFWVSPFIGHSDLTTSLAVYLFGARPDDASLVPGEVVPDSLYRALKALADPTRLKIMKYLADTPQTPTELANKLRLRPPTVIHHLHTLRLAQLVYVSISAEGRRYAARTEAIDSAMTLLKTFLQPEDLHALANA